MRSFKDKLLVIEDHPFIGSLLKEILAKAGYPHVDLCLGTQVALGALNISSYSLILLDHDLTEMKSFEVLQRLVAAQKTVVLLVDAGHVDTAVAASHCGAAEVLEKPLHAEKVMIAVERILARSKTSPGLETQMGENSFHGLIGTSPAMRKIFGLIERIKESCVNILITGPSGSGKEMIAKALHKTSPRADQKFVAINCSAIPDTLLEGELFGYKKGAFTDARADKVGLFQEADQGTIFLDEIGDMPLSVQPKILRAIQEREIRALGGLQSVKIDVRIIAATNQNLQEKIAQKIFREDLYYRLNAMQIELPPLLARTEDIPLLAQHFLAHFSAMHGHRVHRITDEAMMRLLEYSWPGNVRELENAMERATLMSKKDFIEAQDLLFPQEEKKGALFTPVLQKRALAEIERDYIMQILNASGGNRSATAQILQIGRKTLYNKLARYGI